MVVPVVASVPGPQSKVERVRVPGDQARHAGVSEARGEPQLGPVRLTADLGAVQCSATHGAPVSPQ